jgi:hypothetical protein
LPRRKSFMSYNHRLSAIAFALAALMTPLAYSAQPGGDSHVLLIGVEKGSRGSLVGSMDKNPSSTRVVRIYAGARKRPPQVKSR